MLSIPNEIGHRPERCEISARIVYNDKQPNLPKGFEHVHYMNLRALAMHKCADL
jgi:hypothetical protein